MRRTSGAWTRSVVLLIAAWSGSAPSEVTLDGSLGGARGPLPGPDFEIGADFGRQVGSNLFHSFGALNLNASESATFSGPDAINNVLGRVTGGGSNIDGLLRSTIPDANLFLLNPAGIVFGPSARLDVQGSFHASTGDFIRLADGRRFDAMPSGQDALLTTAAPQAFGFLGDHPAPIEVKGSLLEVPEGKTLSLVGGDIRVQAEAGFPGELIARAGRINLASVGAKAEVTLATDDLGVEPRSRGGTVTLSEGSRIDTSGEGGGSVFIRGGQLVMDDRSEVVSVTRGAEAGGKVSIDADQIKLLNKALIGTISIGSGRGGDVTVKARDLDVRSGAAIATFSGREASAHGGDVSVTADRVFLSGDGVIIGAVPTTEGAGPGGDLSIKARHLVEVRNGAAISALSDIGGGRAGAISVESDRILLSADGSDRFTGVVAISAGSESAGAVTIKARDLQVRSGALIKTDTVGSGPAGNILVEADSIFLAGEGTPFFSAGISAKTASDSTTGNAGNITIRGKTSNSVGSLEVRDGSEISTSTQGDGDAGRIDVNADSIKLVNRGRIASASGSEPDAVEFFVGTGDAGRVSVDAERLEISEGGSITTTTRGPGRGGTVAVAADEIVLQGRDSGLFARAEGTAADSGGGGDLTVNAANLMIKEGATIDSTTVGDGNAGAIDINAKTITLARRGSIESKSGELDPELRLLAGHGNAGRVSVDAERLEITEGGSITTTTRGPGRGGAVSVKADRVSLSGDGSIITAATLGSGDAGTVTVTARDLLEVRDGAEITTNTLGDGDAGRIDVKADTIKLGNRGKIASASGDRLRVGTGDAGRVSVGAERLEISDGESMTTTTRGPGRGGAVSVDADRVLLSGDGAVIEALTRNGTGDAGSVTVTARDLLEVRDGAEITTSTLGDGDAGRIDVKANTVKLLNRGRIASASSSDPDAGEFFVGTGDAGHVSVGAERLEITEGGNITTSTRGPGRGGTIEVTADEIVVQGSDSGLFASAEGTAPGSGGGGDLTVNAGSLMVKEGATISASTRGPGRGGELSITAVDLELRDGASITSESRSGGSHAGRSGKIFIQAADSFRLFNDSQVSVKTARANAGDIALDVGFLLHLRDSSITTSVAGGKGDGGDINIDPVFVILDNSDIIATAREGHGGTIHIDSDFFFKSPDSNVDASSGNPRLSGTVEIDSPDTDLNAGLVPLPANFFDAATLLTQGCAPGADLSRLVVRKYEVLPDSPAALRVPPPGGLLNANEGGGFALTRETLGPSFEYSSACGGDG